MQNLCKANPQLDVRAFDESRFGTHSKIGHGWFDKGDRPRVKIKMGFKNFYVYSSVNVRNGETFNLMMPYVNTDCMTVFLEELSKELGNQHTFLIMDRAAWHKSKSLIVPENIHIIFLPPYSPELNPVERLWRFLKSKLIRNKIYDSLEDLYQAVEKMLKSLQPNLVSSICTASYLRN